MLFLRELGHVEDAPAPAEDEVALVNAELARIEASWAADAAPKNDLRPP